MANVHCGLASIDAANSGKKHRDLPKHWSPAYGLYLASAMANKQWPQARCAAAKKAKWTNDDTCRLCNRVSGTALHRHTCTATHPSQPPPMPAHIAEDAKSRTQQQLELWMTRGIGGTHVFLHKKSAAALLEWIKPVPPTADLAQLSWYVDASQIDAKHDATARFGFGAAAVTPKGS